jgi:intein/homing endonuclease
MKGTKVTVKKSPLPLPIKKKGRAYLRRNVPTVGQAVGVAQEVVSEDVFKGYRMVVMLLPPAMQDRRPRMYATKASQLVPGMFVLEANLEYARIVSVTPVQGRPHRVYDVALERTGNYIANGIFLGGW